MNPVVDAKLRELLGFAKEHGLVEVAWQEKEVTIAFRRRAPSHTPAVAAASAESSAPQAPEEEVVRSPIVGTFRRSGSKDRPPLVLEGSHVKPGDRLGIVECMKIPNDVVAFAAGRITKIHVQDGDSVEYGQPLFSVAAKESEAAG
jgi:biotin carboxyl carrier protein